MTDYDLADAGIPEVTTPTVDALLYIVNDPSGTPADNKITVANLKVGMNDGTSGGRTITGGTGSAEALTLASTSDVTKGKINVGSILIADDGNSRVDFGAHRTVSALNPAGGKVNITNETNTDMMTFYRYNPPAVDGWGIGTKIGAQGQILTNAWVLVSGTGDFRPPTADPAMIGIVCDVDGPGIQMQGNGLTDNYAFGTIDANGMYRFAIDMDGKMWWGSTSTTSKAAMDTNLYRPYPNVLKTDDSFWPSSIAIGTTSLDEKLHVVVVDNNNTAVMKVVTLGHNASTTTPDTGFGSELRFQGEDTTTEDVEMGGVYTAWTTATHASRKARMTFSAYDTAERKALMIEASGAASMIGFQGTAPIVKPTVTGSRGSNAALASLITALANYGLVVDSSS